MTKRLLKISAVLFAACALFSSCQKEQEIIGDKDPVITGKNVIIPYDLNLPILKGIIITKLDSIKIWDNNSNAYLFHKTKKVKDVNGRLQEWLYIDAATSSLSGQLDYYPGDATGLTHGIYYDWVVNFESNFSQSDWDYLTVDKNENPTSGFHIPTVADINKLVAIIGNTSKIRSFLACTYDGAKNWGPDYSPNFAGFWVYKPGDPNTQPGCGVYIHMDKNAGDRLSFFYTNIPQLGVNVRLVRDITLSQW